MVLPSAASAGQTARVAPSSTNEDKSVRSSRNEALPPVFARSADDSKTIVRPSSLIVGLRLSANSGVFVSRATVANEWTDGGQTLHMTMKLEAMMRKQAVRRSIVRLLLA